VTARVSLGASLGASAMLLLAGCLCYPFRASLPIELRGVLADFFWSGAFACALVAMTRSWRWALVGFVIAEVLELAQLHPAVPGTFDVSDIIAIAIGWVLGLAVATIPRYLRRNESSLDLPALPLLSSSRFDRGLRVR
jgi:hypothetical protein